MAYDVYAVRARFPALAEGAAHFDAPGGTQVPDVVAHAVAATLTSAVANRGLVTRAERRAEEIVAAARVALADLVGGDPRGVVIGRSMTQLTYDVSRALARTWGPGDEVVVTSLDHDANHRPWVQAAAAAGATVRVAEFDPATGELPPERVADVIGPRTRLVALTAASNLIGTRPDIPAVAKLAHDVGALVYADGVHATAHVPTDLATMGADFYAFSPYKLLGPHCGVVVADPALLETLRPDKLLPSTDDVPERFELGTLPYELLAGAAAAVDFVAGLGDLTGAAPSREGDDRRTRVLRSMAAVEAHEDRLRERMEAGLAALPGVHLYSRAARRTPTLLFRIDGHDDEHVREHLAQQGVNAPCSHFYAIECSRRLGLSEAGAIRVGLAPYSDDTDVDRLLSALADLT